MTIEKPKSAVKFPVPHDRIGKNFTESGGSGSVYFNVFWNSE